MAKKEKSQVVESENPLMQKPTITDAVTYIVDGQGNEIKQEPEKEKLISE